MLLPEGQTLLFGATEELLSKLFPAVRVTHHDSPAVGCANRFPVDLSELLEALYIVLGVSMVLAVDDLVNRRAAIPRAQEEHKSLTLLGREAHFT